MFLKTKGAFNKTRPTRGSAQAQLFLVRAINQRRHLWKYGFFWWPLCWHHGWRDKYTMIIIQYTPLLKSLRSLNMKKKVLIYQKLKRTFFSMTNLNIIFLFFTKPFHKSLRSVKFLTWHSQHFFGLYNFFLYHKMKYWIKLQFFFSIKFFLFKDKVYKD